jgi:predicted amidohydrolase
LRQTKANIETIRRVVAEHPGADLVVFPELFLSGYTLSDIDELAVHLDGPELKKVADIAQESSTALIFGAPERVSGGVANSAFCIDGQGTIAAVYRKAQLYGGEESDAFVASDELLVVELCGLKMGIMICFDVEFPDSDAGRAAADVLEKAIRKSHDRLCTVTRTVELGTPVDALLHGESLLTASTPA